MLNQNLTNFPNPWFLTFLIPLAVWDVVIKGFALWKAARHGQKYWFIALLIVNSLGILPLVYIFFFQKSKRVK